MEEDHVAIFTIVSRFYDDDDGDDTVANTKNVAYVKESTHIFKTFFLKV